MRFRFSLFKTAVVSLLTLAVAFAAVACGGGDDSGGVTLKDFEGSWNATSFVITSNDDPSMSLDLVAMGATFSLDADDSGHAEGSIVLPQAQGGATLPFIATLEIVDQESIKITLDQEIPPLLTSFTGPFTLEGDTFTVTDPNSKFDFEDGKGEVSVKGTSTLVRQ